MVRSKNYLQIVKALATNDFKLRYSGSILGYLWSLLNPLLFFAVLYIVFKVLFRFEQEFYSIYLFLGILLWTFLAECTSRGMTSVKEKGGLIKKIIFPRQIVVYSSSLTTLMTLLINMCVFFLFFFIAGGSISWTWLLFPLYVVELLIFASGISFFLSSFFLKLRDLDHLWGIALQLWFWMTPIWYPASLIPGKYSFILSINPMARLVTDSRNALIYHTFPTLRHQIVNIIVVCLVFAVGYYFFKKRSKYFVDDL